MGERTSASPGSSAKSPTADERADLVFGPRPFAVQRKSAPGPGSTAEAPGLQESYLRQQRLEFSFARLSSPGESVIASQPVQPSLMSEALLAEQTSDPLQMTAAGEVGNRTGMPDRLKTGLERLSGHDLSPVRVHYNSARPAQLYAHAYTQGTDIHVAPSQEKHLPHEGWHVVQQMQGRVKPTIEAGGVSINDDRGLENEAEVMGRRADAVQRRPVQEAGSGPVGGVLEAGPGQGARASEPAAVIQRVSIGEMGSVLDKLKGLVFSMENRYGADTEAIKKFKTAMNVHAKNKGKVWGIVTQWKKYTTASRSQAVDYVVKKLLKKTDLNVTTKGAWEEKILQEKRNQFRQELENDTGSDEEVVSQVELLGKHKEDADNPVTWETVKPNIEEAIKQISNKGRTLIGKQGQLGDCWLIASIGAVGFHAPEVLSEVVQQIPQDNADDADVGVKFKVKLHPVKMITTTKVITLEDVTQEIVVDDKLPYWKAKLLYGGRGTRGKHVGPLVGLIEKAYASQKRGYEAITSKNPRSGLAMLTGKEATSIAIPIENQEDKDKIALLQKQIKRSKKVVPTISVNRQPWDDNLSKWGSGEDHAMVLTHLDERKAEFFDQGLGKKIKIDIKHVWGKEECEYKPDTGKHFKYRFTELTWVVLD